MANRDATFDIMKGIAILAMVIGHCPIPDVLEKFIFVWHMPLFFLVSGYFYSPKEKKEYVRKNARQLVLPYVVTSLVLIFIGGTKELIIGKGTTQNTIIAALIGNGTINNPTFSEYSIGAIWFLLAMFWCRCIYNILYIRLSEPIFGVTIVSAAVIATYLGSLVYVPTDLLEGIEAMLFFYIGNKAHSYNILDRKTNIVFYITVVLLVALSIYAGSMSMVRCYYGYWPINYLAAIGMTMVLYYISKCIVTNRFLAWCGRVSMVILCVHIIALNYLPTKTLHERLFFSSSFDVLLHIFVALFMTWVLLNISLIRSLFSIK